MPLSLIVQNSQQLEETSEGVNRKMDETTGRAREGRDQILKAG